MRAGLTIKLILIIFGLATSIPLIIAGSALLMAMLDRYPILVWAGAALLGWVAGEIMIKDAGRDRDGSAKPLVDKFHLWAAAAVRSSWSGRLVDPACARHRRHAGRAADASMPRSRPEPAQKACSGPRSEVR